MNNTLEIRNRSSKDSISRSVGREVPGCGCSPQKGGQNLTDIYDRDVIISDSSRMNTHFKRH
jgi:hypothetical protein